jgi:TIR domain
MSSREPEYEPEAFGPPYGPDLKRHRENLGLKVADVARALNFRTEELEHYEMEHPPPRDIVGKLLDFYENQAFLERGGWTDEGEELGYESVVTEPPARSTVKPLTGADPHSPIEAFREGVAADADAGISSKPLSRNAHAEVGTLVFLCHSSVDKRQVRDLYRRLTADNINCWFDEENLLPGQDWEYEIGRAIGRSRFVLACLSQKSVTRAGFVQKEIRRAIEVAAEQPEGVAYIIPVRLEECDVPDRLSQWQWVDQFNDNGYERLVRGLRAGLSYPSASS